MIWLFLYGLPLAIFVGWLLLRSPSRRGQWLGLLAALGLPTALVIALLIWVWGRAG